MSSNETDNKNEEPVVLIVDDIPDNINVIANILSSKSIDIIYTNSGEKALQSLNSRNIDLVLLDIAMPEMDGYEVCEIIKSNDKLKHIPVIFLTAKTEAEDIMKGFQVGAVDYITKPFRASELLSRIETHLELKKSKDIIARQNKQLAEQNEKLKELNETKDKFLSIIAHDLKNPLNNVTGFAELLIKKGAKLDAQKSHTYFNLIYQSGRQAFDLLDNLLQWTRSQTGRIKWIPKEIRISDTVKNLVEMAQTSANRKNITVKYMVPDDIIVFADENMVNTIIRNLLSNALKFTENNGEIIISAHYGQDGMTQVNVKDNGIGIKDEDKEKIFDIASGHSTNGTDHEKGTGLGLQLCKEFVERHNGKIWFESEYEKGSCFCFTLPAPPKASDF